MIYRADQHLLKMLMPLSLSLNADLGLLLTDPNLFYIKRNSRLYQSNFKSVQRLRHLKKSNPQPGQRVFEIQLRY
jgi:hypothetical protein